MAAPRHFQVCETFEENSSSPADPSMQFIDIYEYLNDVERELLNGGMNQMQITESHRKTMLRALLGMTKVGLDERMREERAGLQRAQVVRFLEEDLVSALEDGVVIDETAAPYFQSALDRVLTAEEPSPKPIPQRASADGICSPMARGRVYKGKFLDLLSDIVPKLVPEYQSAALVTDRDVMLSLVNNLAIEDNIDVDACKKCIQCDLPAEQNDTGGSGAGDGLRCEAKCIDFLTSRSLEPSRLILSNVFVKPLNCKRQSRQASDRAIIATSIDLDGICSEFDAIVVEKVNDEHGKTTAMRVCEVWEAKVTISPLTIHDALTKKSTAMKSLLSKEDTLILLDEAEYLLVGDEEPVVGVFGNELLPPKRAANQLKVVACRSALSSDVDTVIDALETGYVVMSSDRSSQAVKMLQSIVGEIEKLVVAIA